MRSARPISKLIGALGVLVLLLVGYTAYAESQVTPLQKALDQPGLEISGHALDQAELRRFYSARDYKEAWDTSPKADRKALADFITSVADFASYHGLEEKAYPIDLMRQLLEAQVETDRLKLELLITDSLIHLAKDLHGDTLNLRHLYPGWEFERNREDITAGLVLAVQRNEVQAYIEALAPSDFDYRKLADALKTYRTLATKISWPPIAQGPTLKLGMSDTRVKQVRARLEAEGYLVPLCHSDTEARHYGPELQKIVIEYQMRNGLEADGNIGAKTVQSMNVSIAQRIDQIRANMERMRHMPSVIPARYAIVNIADASVRVFEKDQAIYNAIVIVGRPDRRTPFVQSEIKTVIFNPSWHVPTKIARQDILPKLRKDPNYLEKMGIVIKDNDGDPHGTMIDWTKVHESDFNFRLRQIPGDLNSLGRIKFDFDNDFSVYMHGTPHEELFAKAERTLSSGCVRLKDPVRFAEIVLASNDGNWTSDKIQAEVDKSRTHWFKVTEPLPLMFVYRTAFFPTTDSPIHFRNDVYGYDSLLLSARKDKFDRR